MRNYLAALAISTAVLATPALAATTIYTNVGDFQSALTGGTMLEDFSDSTWASPLSSITSTKGSLQGNHWTDEISSSASTTFNFSSAINGFGGDFNLSVGGHGPGIALLLNGDTPIGTATFEIPNGNGNDFWGFVSDTAFTSVKLILGTQDDKKKVEAYDLDNLRFGTVQNIAGGVPEPATWALMILGFGLVGGVMRKRQKVTVSYA